MDNMHLALRKKHPMRITPTDGVTWVAADGSGLSCAVEAPQTYFVQALIDVYERMLGEISKRELAGCLPAEGAVE